MESANLQNGLRQMADMVKKLAEVQNAFKERESATKQDLQNNG